MWEIHIAAVEPVQPIQGTQIRMSTIFLRIFDLTNCR